MENIRTIIIVVTIVIVPVLGLTALEAASYCVRQGAIGSSDGSDWDNAFTELPASLERGATYYIADGTYGSCTFDDAEDGALYITVKKAIASDHGTNQGWDSSYGDGFANFDESWIFENSYYVIDGQVGGGPGSWTEGHGFKLTRTTEWRMVEIKGPGYYVHPLPHHLEFKHIDFEHRGMGYVANDDIFYAVNTDGYPTIGSHDILITHCYLHDFSRNAVLTSRASGWIFEYSAMGRGSCVPPMHVEGWQDFYSSDMKVRYSMFFDLSGTAYIALKKNDNYPQEKWELYGNIIYRNDEYDEYIIGGDGVITLSVGTAYVSSTLSFNHNDSGADYVYDSSAGFLNSSDLMEDGVTSFMVRGSESNDGVYEVTGVTDDTITLAAEETLADESEGNEISIGTGWTRDVQIYNNVFVNLKGYNVGITNPLGSDVWVYNNIWYKCTAHAIGYYGFIDNHDYNWYFDNIDDRDGISQPNLDIIVMSNYPEEHGVIGTHNPFVDWQHGDYNLTTAIMGVVLPAPFNRDLFGNHRGIDGTFDIGALEYVGPNVIFVGDFESGTTNRWSSTVEW